MTEEIYRKLTDLLLLGINFRKGDKIYITIEPDQRDAGLAVVKEAYARGALYVEMTVMDKRMMAYAISGLSEEPWFPEYNQARFREISQPGWKRLAIYSELTGDAMKGLGRDDYSTNYIRAVYKDREILTQATMKNKVPWCLTYLPSVTMAGKAFPKLPADEAVKKYWEAVISIMRLDLDDPVAFWKEKMKKDRERSEYMNSLDADYLTFKGPGTDLKVGLCKAAKWIGGYDQSVDGQDFMANIPTDEIFTTPDFRMTEGKVSLTKPFVMHQNLGLVPEKAWFQFKEGKIVDYGAESGKESLDALFAMDERNRYIGEVALVDPQSPFAKTGIIYYNGLYDENAACHLALGRAYGFTLKDPSVYSDEDYLDIGLNTATLHEDMMIGAEDVEVTANLPDGSSVDIIKGGTFVI